MLPRDQQALPSAAGPHPPARAAAIAVALVAVAAAVGQGFGRFVFPAQLPAMKADLLGSYGGAGFLGTVNVAAYLVGAVGVMLLLLRARPTSVLKGGLALSTAALLTLATARGLPQLAIGMVLAGFGGAAIWVPAPGIAGAAFPHRRGVAIGVLNAGIGVGLVLGSQLARAAPSWWGPHGWRGVWALLGAGAAVALVATVALLRTPPGPPATRPRLSALTSTPGWRPFTAAYFLFGFGYIVTMTYVVAALRDGAGFSAAHAANVFALLGVGTVVGGLVLGRLSDRVGRRAALVLGYGVCAACPLLLATGQEPFAAIAGFGFGVGFNGSVSVVAAHLADVARPGEVGAAFGAATVAFGLAQAGGPQVGGWLVDRTGGFEATLAVSSAALALAAVVALGMPSRPAPLADGTGADETGASRTGQRSPAAHRGHQAAGSTGAR